MKIFSLLMAVMPLWVWAQAPNPNVYTYKLGEYEVILLSENQGKGNASILIGATPEMLEKAIPSGEYPNAVNAFLVKTPEQNILFDTGFGRNLTANLASVGVKPEQIGTLVITHAHGDHIGGMLKNGQKAFPNARLIMSDIEKEYWVDNQKKDDVTKAFNAYKDNATLIEPERIEPKKQDGIYFFSAYGHTPGHTVCLVRSRDKELLIWADLTHAMAVQMLYPQVSVRYDSDPVEAAETRQRILSFVAKHNIPVAGMHIAYPGMGKVTRAGNGYVFTPFR